MKKSLGSRLSANPVRISLLEKEERRRTQTLKSKPASHSDETHIPRPRIRSSSVEATGRKSSLKPPARVQYSQYGFGTPQASAPTPSTSRSVIASGSGIRGRSPSAERASSIAPKQSRKDNRPLGEKSFQNEMLSKIDSYLRSIDQSGIVNSSGSIKPITLKMFVEVSDLLVKLLDVKQSLTMLNYVEELPKIAKKLHYPGQINKSWLKTANAMHSWPQVLGWLSWLAEACAARDLAAEHFQLDNLPFIEFDNSAEGLHQMRLEFLLNAYKAWNEEKADEETAVTEAYLDKIAKAQGVSEADIENAMREYESETLKLEDAKAKGAELDEEIRMLEERLTTVKTEEVGQLVILNELVNAKDTYLTESKALEKKTKVLQATFEQQKIKEEELKVQISSQPMSLVERDEIVERTLAMENQMRELDSLIVAVQKNVDKVDLKFSSIRNSMDKVVLAYNKDIYLHLGKEAGIDFEEISMPLEGITRPDAMEVLERKSKLMADYRENLEKQNKNMESMIRADEEELETLEAQKLELESVEGERLIKIKENRNHIKNIRADAEKKRAELQEGIENMKRNIKDMQDKIPNIEEEKKELEEAKEKVEALIRRKDYIEESARLYFDKFYEILASQNERLARLFQETAESE